MPATFADKLGVVSNAAKEEKSLFQILFGVTLEQGYHTGIFLLDKTAKELCLLLRKALKQREEALGHPITLTEAQMQAIGVAPEDW